MTFDVKAHLDQQNARLKAATAYVQTLGIDFPVDIPVPIGRTTDSGLLLVGKRLSENDVDPWLWFVTDCCFAAAKGGEDCIYCKGCYEEVDPIYGDVYTLEWHGEVEPLTDEDRARWAAKNDYFVIKGRGSRQQVEAYLYGGNHVVGWRFDGDNVTALVISQNGRGQYQRDRFASGLFGVYGVEEWSA